MALFISMRKPRLIWTSPWSSSHGTRNIRTRSGSIMRSRIFARAGTRDGARAPARATRRLPGRPDGTPAPPGFLAFTSAISVSTYVLIPTLPPTSPESFGTIAAGQRVNGRGRLLALPSGPLSTARVAGTASWKTEWRSRRRRRGGAEMVSPVIHCGLQRPQVAHVLVVHVQVHEPVERPVLGHDRAASSPDSAPRCRTGPPARSRRSPSTTGSPPDCSRIIVGTFTLHRASRSHASTGVGRPRRLARDGRPQNSS